MQTTERPIDLTAARKARALAHPSTTGDRWADLHGAGHRPIATPSGPGTVIRFRPGR